MGLLENLTELLAIKRARWNLHAFIKYTKPKYESTWFNQIVCDALQRVEARIVARDDARLLIRMPPRSGKSEIVSRKFPAWFMGRHPEMDIINSSYNAKLAKNLGGHARNLMGTELYQRVFPGVRLSKDSKSKDKWNTEAGGSFTAAGVEGGLTGEGAHCFPAGTMVLTDHGTVPIEELKVGANSCKVLAYDESKQKLVYKEIQAISRREGVGLYRITSANGRMVEATGDHPFWTSEGYVRADSLAPGDRLLCTVSKEGDTVGVRHEQARQSQGERLLLFTGMPGASRERKAVSTSCLQTLRESGSKITSIWFSGIHLLFRRMHGDGQSRGEIGAAGCVANKKMSGMRSFISGDPWPFKYSKILWNGLQEQGTCAVDDGRSKPRIHSRPVAFARATACGTSIQDYQAFNFGAGQWMRPLSWLRAFARSSYRFGPKGQPMDKSGDDVPQMSLQNARASKIEQTIEADRISKVERIVESGSPTTVYDLQVADTHNFFANGFLVHNCLILDDFYKNAKEAWSALVRENVEDWYKSVAYTRLAPGGAVIILCTQWHEAGLDNAVQRWAKEDPEGPQWEVIDIPAIMEESYRNKHPMDLRKDGESYWPERWPVKKLKSIMKVVGSYIWSALYQQRASSEAGAIVLREWIQYWSKLPARFDDMVISCDLAFKGKEDSDNVAMQVWGRVKVKITYEDKSFDYDYHYYLIDRISRPMEFVATLQAFDLLARRYPKAKQLVEDKANGPALQSVLKKKYPRIIMVPVDTDKAGRFRAVAPIFERRCVFLPDPKVHAWSETVTDEYVKFPNVDHDDDVDATSQGLGHWEVPADGVPGFVAAVM